MTSLLYPVTNLLKTEQLNIVRGEGIYVFDDQGRRYLEGLSGLWCSALGYGNQELIEAITRQLETLAYSHLFGGRTHPAAMALGEILAAMVPVEDARIFLANSGSEANDSLLKLLHYYHNVTGRPEKKKIITFERCYHGVTLAAAALTGLPVMHRNFDIPTAALGILRTATPHYYHGHRDGESEAQFVQRILEELRALIEAEGPQTIAALVAEPVGGAAGVIVAPDGYYPALQKLLAEYGILFWADEVICGFGRTGRDFGCNTMGIQPQLMSLAKQMSSAYIPISAAVVPGYMVEAMGEPSAAAGAFGHGFTYSGHPVACAAALKAIEIYHRDRLFEHAARVGAYLQAQLQQFADHPLVGEVRGKGMIAAVELVADKTTRKAFEDGRVGDAARLFCQQHGLLIRVVSGSSVAFCPPLVTTTDQIDELVSMFTAALNDTHAFARKKGLLAA